MNVLRIIHACKGTRKNRNRTAECGYPKNGFIETHDYISDQSKYRGIFDLLLLNFLVQSNLLGSGEFIWLAIRDSKEIQESMNFFRLFHHYILWIVLIMKREIRVFGASHLTYVCVCVVW